MNGCPMMRGWDGVGMLLQLLLKGKDCNGLYNVNKEERKY